jgi:hypothetical protein
MRLTFAVIYLSIFTVLLLVLAAIWHWQMAGHYFLCPDRGYVTDFFPPFVRGDGDLYVKPASTVYAIWAVFAGVAILVPAVTSWLVIRAHHMALRKAWM